MLNKPMPNAAPQNSLDMQKQVTSEIASKATSPTLVEFHNKNATVPEWRLQLQNAVRQRQGRNFKEAKADEMIVSAPVKSRTKLITNGANALKTEIAEEPNPASAANPELIRALKRIESSRQKFLVEEKLPTEPTLAPKANKNYPFYIAAKTNETEVKPAEINPPIGAFAKPKLASSRVEMDKLDTNKLPPLPKIAENPTNFDNFPVASRSIEIEKTERIEVKVAESHELIEIDYAVKIAETESEEFDDYPTFATRFNAGFFDLIIGSFASLLLLAPFMFLGGSWLSAAGIFAFLATCSIVMFIYMTTTVGLYGKTFGMRLFSLEVIDIKGEEYPTLHQSAVSSAVYLLSLALGGIGFLTLPFNEDKRAVHDLVSGTMIVREG